MERNSSKRAYKKKFQKYGINPRTLRWASTKAAKQRYEQFISDLDYEGKSILDVGCGFGDIISSISKAYDKFEYTGVDEVCEFISAAQKLHPKHKFIVRDYFEKPLPGKFDIVISCGALNSNVPNNMSFRKHVIKTMFGNTREALVFNMRGGARHLKTPKSSNTYYANSLDILKYCLSLTNKVILRHHYHSKDFTIVMFK